MKNFLNRLLVFIRKPTKFISDGLFGTEHTLAHRVIVGFILMAVGVEIASLAEFVNLSIFKLSLDGTGYLIHGIGSVPLVEVLRKITDNE